MINVTIRPFNIYFSYSFSQILVEPIDPNYYKTHACAKHYAVHSGPEWNRHEFNAEATPRDLYETYLPAFEALVKEGDVQEVMCAYNRFEGKPCCSSDKLLIDILRNSWGYDNIILSDCGAIDDFWRKDKNTPRHETHPDAESASADAVLNGTDLECGGSYRALNKALADGKIDRIEKVIASVALPSRHSNQKDAQLNKINRHTNFRYAPYPRFPRLVPLHTPSTYQQNILFEN